MDDEAENTASRVFFGRVHIFWGVPYDGEYVVSRDQGVLVADVGVVVAVGVNSLHLYMWGKLGEEAVRAAVDEAERTGSRVFFGRVVHNLFGVQYYGVWAVLGVAGVLDGVGVGVTWLPHFLWEKIAEEAVRGEVGSVEGREGMGGEEMGSEGVSEDEGDE